MMYEMPCKVCGDKSSGINFGVITCQDCYLFFRNSHISPYKNHDRWKTYVCSGDYTCVVDRDNKDCCNDCRYQKCITAGMKYTKGLPCGWTDISNTLKDFTAKVAFLHIQTVSSPETIKMKLRKPQDEFWFYVLKSMTYEEKWTCFSRLMDDMIDRVVIFVENLPQISSYFKVVSNHILISNYCMFELVIIRISRLINLDRDQVLFGNKVIPISECVNACDPLDMEVVSGIFDAARTIARLKLTEEELAIYHTLVLSWPDRYIGERQVNDFMTVLHYQSVAALQEEIQKSHAPLEGDDSVMEELLDMLYTLKSVSAKHIEALRRFEEAFPEHSFEDAELYYDIYGTPVPNPSYIRTAYSSNSDFRKNDSRTY